MPASCPADRDRLHAARLHAAMGDHETIGEAIQWHAARAVECREMLRDDIHGYRPLKPERVRRIERELYEHECSYQILFRQQEREILMATGTKSHVNGKSGSIAKMLKISPEAAAQIVNPISHKAAAPESRAAKMRRELGLKEKPSARKETPEDDVVDRQAHFLGMDYAEPEDEVEPVVPVRASSVEDIEVSPEFAAVVDRSFAPVQYRPGRTIQAVFCTPEIAKEFLKHRSAKLQRNLVKADYMRIAKDIKEGRWVDTGETIAFDINGNLVDGQHRLEAIVEAGIGIWLDVMRGVPAKAMRAGGCGRKKTKGDAIRSQGCASAPQAASAIDFILSFNPFDATFSASPSNARTADFYEEHPEVESSVYQGRRLAAMCKTNIAPVVAHWYFAAVDPVLADQMFDRLATMSEFDAQPQLKVLYAYLQAYGSPFKRKVSKGKSEITKESPRIHIVRLLAAFVLTWNAIRNNRSFTRIQMPREFPQIDGLEA